MGKGRILTIGSFDGVHSGHAALLNFTVAAAKKRKLRPAAITFRIPPKMVLNSEAAPILLSDTVEKELLLRAHGIDEIHVLNFDEKLLTQHPFLFFRDVLLRRYNAKGLVVGMDFRFGAGRTAGALELVRWGQEFEIPVWVIPAVKRHGVTVSSSRIRELLSHSRLRAAEGLLGHPYLISGRVVAGKAKGRELGFRTANLETAPGKLLPSGVYAVKGWIEGPHRRLFKGVANIGVRPTLFSDRAPAVEVHLFKHTDSLRGKRLSVELVARLRGEKKFPSVDALKKAIAKDVRRAQLILYRAG
jgi:riboflavin kinase/FMN adenylyltransferase